MRERGMRAIAPLCKHTNNKADAVPVNNYLKLISFRDYKR